MKKHLSIFVWVVIIAVMVSCCQRVQETKQPILILYAFNEEGALLADRMEKSATDTLLGREVYSGTLSEKNIVLAESGVGMTNAAMTCQAVIDKYNPRTVIFSGIAGAIDSSVHIGDITICDSWITHDYGYVGKDGFEIGAIEVVNQKNGKPGRVTIFKVDSTLFALSDSLAKISFDFDSIGSHLPRILTGGTGVSGNQFIDQVEKREWLSGEFKAQVTDMETASVAQVCTVNEIPFIGFRSASDLAGGSGSSTARTEIDKFFAVAASNSARVVMKYLELIK